MPHAERPKWAGSRRAALRRPEQEGEPSVTDWSYVRFRPIAAIPCWLSLCGYDSRTRLAPGAQPSLASSLRLGSQPVLPPPMLLPLFGLALIAEDGNAAAHAGGALSQ